MCGTVGVGGRASERAAARCGVACRRARTSGTRREWARKGEGADHREGWLAYSKTARTFLLVLVRTRLDLQHILAERVELGRGRGRACRLPRWSSRGLPRSSRGVEGELAYYRAGTRR
jgi:hypothetical protein